RGLKPGADQTAINFAAHAEDEQQIIVPRRVHGQGATAVAAPDAGEALATGRAATPTPTPGLDLSTATAAEIDAAVEGFGPTLAVRIVEFRDQSGDALTSVDQLSEVPGIGEARIDALRAAFEPAETSRP
nr:helix-hairpin-helix domain-containing protein [Thermoleophilaceae bacterium]